MRIIKLEAENVKRIKAISIEPDGTIVQISGKNGAGKSSVLDAIMFALAGGRTIDPKPVRDGQSKASVRVDLGEIIVTRTWDKKGKSTLTVTNKDGAKYTKAQNKLNEIIGNLSFDPLAFTNLDSKKQVEILKDILGIDFTDLERQKVTAFEERTDANRHLKELKAQAADMSKFDALMPVHEVSMFDLVTKLKDEQEVEKNNADQIKRLVRLNKSRDEFVCDIEQMERNLETKRNNLAIVTEDAATQADIVQSLPGTDTKEIMQEMSEIETSNADIRQNNVRADKDRQIKEDLQEIEELTTTIEGIDEYKRKQLAEATFPIDGLSFDDDCVTYNGIPFSQASKGEQLKVSIAMGFALNPKLKVVLIRDGSLLDKTNLQVIADMAEAERAQVWLETVSDDSSSGIVIEDGEIKE